MVSQPPHSQASIPSTLDPRRILDMNYAFAATAMLIAAVRLHIFTHMAHKVLTPAGLAALAHIAPEPTERLLKGLEVQGLVEREGDTYRLTALSDHFLVEGRPGYLGGDTLAMLDYLPAWFELDHTLSTSQPYRDLGDAATAEAFFAPRVRDLFPLVHPVAKRTAAIVSLDPHERLLHVLDVGAGSAPWSAAFARQYPDARVTAVDLPGVVAHGRQQIAELGMGDRYSWLEGDMETVAYLPLHYDLVILAHISRFIGEKRTCALLGKLTNSLRGGGTLILADVFLADDRSGPAAAFTLDLSMLVNTAQGRIWTCSEVSGWLKDSGLCEVQRLDGVGPFPVLVARKGEGK